MTDPWAQFRDAPSSDPWAAFADAPAPGDGHPGLSFEPGGGQTDYEAAIASPEGQKLAGELRTKADKTLLSEAAAQGYGDVSNPTGTFLREAANTATLNIPRNISAGVETLRGGDGRSFKQEYDYLKAIDEASARQSPVASGAGTVAGIAGQIGVMPTLAAESLFGRAVPTALARGVQGAALGAGLSGISEFADTKDLGRAGEATLQGAGLGGALGTAGGKLEAAFAPSKKPVIPSTEELKAVSQAAYGASEKAGLILRPEGVKNLAGDLERTLAAEGYHPKLGNQSKLGVVLDEMTKLGAGNVTLKGLDVIRKMANSARTDADPSTRRLGAVAIEKVDDFLNDLKPSDILAGDKVAGVGALKEARSLWSSFRKADMVDEALAAAQTRAASTGTGGNIDNAIRQEFRKILQNKKKSASFSDKEKGALARIVTGTAGQNTLRALGKLSPVGDGLRLLLHAGAATASGGATLPFAALGAGAKALADRATPQNVERLSRMIRARGMNIDPQELIAAQGQAKLRNFFTSIGINVEKMLENASDGDAGEVPSLRQRTGIEQ